LSAANKEFVVLTNELRYGKLLNVQDNVSEVVVLEEIGEYAFKDDVGELRGFALVELCAIRRRSPSTT
jgi:hypothetical protein